MKKRVLIIVMCCAVLLFGCNTILGKYKRISYNGDTLGVELAKYIGENTSVVNMANEEFPTLLPIYSINQCDISREDYQEMQEKLELSNDPDFLTLESNVVHYNLVSYTDFDRGYFDMTDEELEKLAWETFNKIPFMEGEYEYLGIRNTMTVNDAEGDHVTRAGVVFCRLLDGVRVVGEDKCVLYFDGSGLVEIRIELYDYKEIGTMDMVPLEEAAARIKTPDSFSVDINSEETNIADTLQVDRVKLLLVNQYSEGCTILQPVYNFIGTAALADGTQAEFSSKIIAIPESYTYESE